MLNSIVHYFTPPERLEIPELFRKHKLVVIVILLTALFDLNYTMLTVKIEMSEGTRIMLCAFLIHCSLLFLAKTNISLIILTNIYVLVGVIAVNGCIYFSGGFNSPVLPWLASSPIVAMLMAGRATGIFWAVINTLTVIILGVLAGGNYDFPKNYNHEWHTLFSVNCYSGLVMIIFVVSLVFENGKNSALKKLAEKSILLAEEKKKTALNQISQEIHDNVGQNLSIVKMNLHLLEMLKDKQSDARLKDSLELLGEAIKNLRGISHVNYEDEMPEKDLVEALGNEINKLSKTGQYEAKINIEGNVRPLNRQTEFVLSRIAKEAINNIIKHAQASAVSLCIKYEPGYCTMIIHDNGIGIEKDKLSSGFGLKSMFSRTSLAAGNFQIDSAPGKGTSIIVQVPTSINAKSHSDEII